MKNNISAKALKYRPRAIDRGMLTILLLLLGVGLAQVYSSSFIFATEARGDGLHYFRKQLIFVLAAIPLILAVASVPFRWIERWGHLLWWGACFGVLLTFVPGLGVKAGGAVRWLRLPGGFHFEPSELLKISLPIFMATILSRKAEWMGQLEWPLKILFLVAPLLVVLKQPDFGTFVIGSGVLLTVLFVYGIKWRYIIASVLVVVPTGYWLIVSSAYRKARLMAFLDPWADPTRNGFQVIQSMLSFHSGGLTGRGLGQGQGKLFFLPEAHTDFTLAVFGEEVGFIGFAILLTLYGFLIFRGLQISMQAQRLFHRLAVLGLTVNFAFSIFVNVGVALGFLPPKGLTLLFMSYGGSSLMTSALAFGLILNFARHVEAPEDGVKKKRFQRQPLRTSRVLRAQT